MAYKALYRRYRPNNFDEVMGQKYIIQTIKNAIVNEKVGHAYLFSGPRGIGKTTIARIIAKAVNCPNAKDGNPCNDENCPVCHAVNEGSAIDVVEIDAASNNGVEEMRALLEKVNFLPAEFKHKIYIIDEVHMLSISAFNALLKTLEEPPLHVIFILATTEPHRVPSTILSRCQRFDFKPLSVFEIKEQLSKVTKEENIKITPEALEVIAEAADGGMRDALSILDQLASFGDEEITAEDVNNVTGRVDSRDLIKLLKAIAQGKASDALDIMNSVLNTGKEVSVLVQSLLSLCRDVILFQNVKSVEPTQSLFNNDDFVALAQNTKRFKLFKYVDILNDIQNKIKYTNAPKIYLEVGIVKMIANEAPVVSNSNVTVDLSEVNDKIYQLELQIKEQSNVKIPEDLGEFKDFTKSKLEFLEEMVSRCAVPPKDLEERIEILEENEFGDEIEKRLAALEQAVSTGVPASVPEQNVENAEASQEYTELMNRLVNLEAQVNANQASAPVQSVDTSELEDRINNLENTFNTNIPQILDQRYDELTNKINALSSSNPVSPAEPMNLDDIRLQLEAFQNTFITAEELNQKLQSLNLGEANSSNLELEDIYNRLNSLETSLANANRSEPMMAQPEPQPLASEEDNVDEDFFNMIDENYQETSELDKVKENYLALFNLVQNLKNELATQKSALQAQINDIEALKTNIEQLQEKGTDEEALAEIETKINSVKEYAVKLGTRLSVLEDSVKNNKPEPERTIAPRPQPIDVPPRETQQELNQVVTPIETKEEELPEGQVDDTMRVYNIKTIENILHQSRDRRNMEDKEKITNNWSRLGNFVPQTHLGVANTLSFGKVAVNGGNYLIVVYESAKTCNQLMTADYHTKALQVIRTALQKDYDFIALPKNTWLEIVNEYKSQYHMGVKYPTLSPIKNPELKVINVVNSDSFKTTSAQNYDKAKQIFGQNLIKEVKN